jgi:hypothetical protein
MHDSATRLSALTRQVVHLAVGVTSWMRGRRQRLRDALRAISERFSDESFFMYPAAPSLPIRLKCRRANRNTIGGGSHGANTRCLSLAFAFAVAAGFSTTRRLGTCEVEYQTAVDRRGYAHPHPGLFGGISMA